MAVRAKVGISGKNTVTPTVKKTRQGRSARTILSPTPSNGRKKRYRGQGK